MGDGRIGAEEDAFKPAEDGGVGADAEDEAEDGEGGESGIAEELAKAEAQILGEIFGGVEAMGFDTVFFDLSDAADGAEGLGAGLFGGHAGGEVGGDLLVEVIAQLVVDFVVEVVAAEEGEPAEAESIEPGHGQASVRFTMAEMAPERRFQAAASFSSCLRPSAGEGVIAGATIVGAGSPLGADPAALFEFMKGWIEGANADAEDVGRNLFEAEADGPAVEGLEGEDFEQEHVEGALDEFGRLAHAVSYRLPSKTTFWAGG